MDKPETILDRIQYLNNNAEKDHRIIDTLMEALLDIHEELQEIKMEYKKEIKNGN